MAQSSTTTHKCKYTHQNYNSISIGNENMQYFLKIGGGHFEKQDGGCT